MNKIELKLALIVCFVSVLGLIGWANNWIFLTSLKAIYFPIAPLAAILLFLTSITYVSLFIKPSSIRVSKNISFVAVLNISIAFFSLIDYFFIIGWDFEKVFFANLIEGGITGHISPLTAVLLIFANITFLVFVGKPSKQSLNLTRVLFYVQFTISSFFLIAYIENFDEIYINDYFSLAFLTAFCFFILSIIQLKYIEFKVWPFKYFSYSNATNKVVATLLPVFLLYFVVYQYYNHHLSLFFTNKYAHTLFLLFGIIVFYFLVIRVSKNIDDELKNSKSLFEGLFKNATVGLYQSTPDGKVLNANDTLVKMLKYNSLQELLSIDITKGIYVDSRKREEFIKNIEEFGEIKDFENEWKTKNGEIIFVNEGARAVKDDAGQIIRYDGVVEDITIRKNNELALLKMNKAMDNSSDVIFMTDLKGVFTYINPEFTKLYQYSKEEVIGITTPRILKSGKQSTEIYKQFWHKLKNNQKINKLHFINKKKNGELIDIDISVDPIIDELGNKLGYLGIQRDISEQIRNNQIQNIVVSIANASQTISNITQIIDLIQVELGRLIDTKNFYVALYNEESDTIKRIFYKDEKDNILDFPAGKTFTGMVIKQAKSFLLKEAETKKLALENDIEIVGEISKVWLGVPLIINGKSKGAFVVQSYDDENAYDQKDKEMLEIISNQISIVIERKYQEDQLKIAKDKAEENNRLKTLFLANLSHEIRTPMNSILGFSDLLLNKEMSEVKKDKYHEIINSSGKRLMNLINDIIDISKIDAHELKLSSSDFNLNELVDQLHQQFLISPKNKNTTISTVKYLNDEKSFIHLDETRLAQVLSNLLENALKFTHNGTIEFGYTIKENNLHFYVKDSGVGIDAKDHHHIFERFGQSNNEVLKVKDGSGLGLAISKGIVKLMGGQIWVESEPLKGATFHFTIPNYKTTNKEKISNEIPIENVVLSSTKKILIAEDEESNFWFIEAALDDQPFELIHVLNGKEAVEVMQRKNHIDLILMDFNMPIMNGLDATKEIRKTNKSIPIIAVTAYAMTADKEKALEVGCTDYLSKPVTKTLLLETINNQFINIS